MIKKIYLLIGAPGSGKTSTMSKVKSDKISHFSIGEMYRQISTGNDELSQIVKNHIDLGKVVPIDIARKVIQNFIESGKEIVVIDAFPRDMEQTKMLELILSKDIVLKQVIEIIIDPDIAIERIQKRNRGTDDDINLFKDRMNVYNAEINEIREYYLSKGIYTTINGDNPIEIATREIETLLMQ
jgi:adenylate kinase